jgi:predicted acetyltransferase
VEITRKREKNRTRISLMEGSEVLSNLSVLHMRMRIGSVIVRAGGIAGVGTPQQHRMKGYGSRVMEDSTSFMAAQGWELGLLLGIRDFYPRFGYAPVMSACSVVMRTREAETARVRHRTRRMRPEDKRTVLRIHNACDLLRTGSRVREMRYWDPFRKGSQWNTKAEGRMLLDARNRAVGYLIIDADKENTSVAEVGALSRDCCETIISLAAADAVAKRAGEITFHAPPDHPLTQTATRFGARVTVVRNRCGGAMGRVICQDALFAALAPELARRLERSEAAGFRGTLAVRTELGESALELDRGTVRALGGGGGGGGGRGRGRARELELPQSRLAQLVLGYRSIEDLLLEKGVSVRGARAAEVIGEMLPLQAAYIWTVDYF